MEKWSVTSAKLLNGIKLCYVYIPHLLTMQKKTMLCVRNVNTLYGQSRYVYILHILQKLCAHTAHTHYCKSVHILQYSLWQTLCAQTTYSIYSNSRCAHNAHSHYFKSYAYIPHILIVAKVMCTYCIYSLLQKLCAHIAIHFLAKVMCTYHTYLLM
jgi:hypothetical protein